VKWVEVEIEETCTYFCLYHKKITKRMSAKWAVISRLVKEKNQAKKEEVEYYGILYLNAR
jgi:hypothetical protein